ncbi:hypothetical protein A3Q56_02480 [Intoshia linei]|uniref:exodeoxyribonuclease III n=1 Tax=Intoshia linei TaxID=1819745 RepID=A0A177B7Z5_9BILA|nr:hypothetical protein A3Q56_02480 [Intoshia linei]
MKRVKFSQQPKISTMLKNGKEKIKTSKRDFINIISWNINGASAMSKKKDVNYITESDADFYCFQETKSSKEKLPSFFEMEGYFNYYNFGVKNGYSGTGLCSKEKPIKVTYGFETIKEEEGRLITAEMDSFYLVTAYVPNSGRGLVRLDYRTKCWEPDMVKYIKNLQKLKPVIYCGDLNVAHQEIDLTNPNTNHKTAGFTDIERKKFTVMLAETEMIDTFRYLYPETKAKYSFWSYMRNSREKNIGWRLDYFLISEKLKKNLIDSLIHDEIKGSDHCPVELKLKIPIK